ncbi:MAG: hypothetical protein V4659_08270 [Pseudomonadota bacterium]
MIRIVSVAAALAASTMLLSATATRAEVPASTAAAVQVPTGYYVATPLDKPLKTSFLTRETSWKWRGSAFVASKSGERDIVMCSLVAQRAGKLSSFSVQGAPVSAEALDKCNARAK